MWRGTFVLAGLLLGCSGKTYTMTIDRAPLATQLTRTDGLLAKVNEVALRHGFFQIATLDTAPSRRLAYRADVKTLIGEPGVILINVRQPQTTHFVIDITTDPAGDYPQAKSFRDDLKAELTALLPKATISGF